MLGLTDTKRNLHTGECELPPSLPANGSTPDSDTPQPSQDSIQAWTQKHAATWARQRLTRIQGGKDETN